MDTLISCLLISIMWLILLLVIDMRDKKLLKHKDQFIALHKKRIAILEAQTDLYHRAIYDAKKAVAPFGAVCICGVSDLCGNEESMPITTFEEAKKIIEELPLGRNR